MSKRKISKILICICLVITILASLTGCENKKDNEETKKEKINEEMNFLDSKIILLMNLLNNVSFKNYRVVSERVKEEQGENKESKTGASSSTNDESKSKEENGKDNKPEKESNQEENKGNGEEQSGSSKEEEQSGSSKDEEQSKGSKEESNQSNSNNKEEGSEDVNKEELYGITEQNILSVDSNLNIKWNEIQSEIEKLYTIWTTITLDLKSVQVSNDDILKFNEYLDRLSKSAKDKNKNEALKNLSDLYSLIPKYFEQYSEDETKKATYKTKLYILYAYSIADKNEWDEMDKNIKEAKQEFKKVIENNKNEYKNLNINRAELQLADMEKTLLNKDKEIFFLKYKNLMQELNML